MKRVCLSSPATRTPEATGKAAATAGRGDWVSTAATGTALRHSNTTAQRAAKPVKTLVFLSPITESDASGQPSYRNRTGRLTDPYFGRSDCVAVLQPCDASLATERHWSYESGADGLNFRLCRVQPPGAARDPRTLSRGSCVPPAPPRSAQRAIVMERRLSPSGLRIRTGDRICKGCDPRQPPRATCAALEPSATDNAGHASEQNTTAKSPQLNLDGPTLDAPDCTADRNASFGNA